VYYFIRAVQKSKRGVVVNAPRLTMMSGQRAYTAVSTERSYVSDIDIDAAEAAAYPDPTIDTVQDGIVFDVRPTVSADRRYVQMDLRPSLSVVEEMREFQVSGGGLFGNATIQQPEISTQEFRTTVSVPDGGTLLLGGLSYAHEAELESGIPVLSKIPFLGKLFSSRSISREKSNLVVLVKPTIIIQEEAEEEAR
jgi:type II secretory pathway component GspD/PulD (secretin)